MLVFCTRQPEKEKNDTSQLGYFVDPFIGTTGFGKLSPGAILPFGQMQIGPATEKGSNQYNYIGDTIRGFYHLQQLNGHAPDFSLFPMLGQLTKNIHVGSFFSHNAESAIPGYYKVRLLKDEIVAEITTTGRAALYRFTFPEASVTTILLNLHDSLATVAGIKIIDNKTITGYKQTAAGKVCFAVSFIKPFYNYVFINQHGKTIRDTTVVDTLAALAGFEYATEEGEALLVKVGVSFTSEENALLNLGTELPGWNFDLVRKEAARKWLAQLSKIVVETENLKEKTYFTQHCTIAR
ncbi:MAG: hypothetical protein HC896_15160 [Bacteroidales bacterium]|nr:hypothetical protein [Bacteroidales bacterium]